MPEGERFAALLESLADGTPIDWAAAEAATTSDEEREWLRQLRRLELAVAQQKRSPSRAATWSHLELIERVGAGAFGEVYRAHDPRLARDVALKLLYETMLANDARASAVIEEGRLLARVRHPNVVTVYGAECRDGQVGIWTEFIDGQTLQAIVTDRGPLTAAEVTAIGLDLCRALAAVHDAGLLHRDIKAQNVMREAGGRIVLMDFGTGRDLDPMPGQKTDVSGTPLYLAPELFTGGEASAASDIYALGVLLYFLLTGRYPVSGRTLGQVRDGHRTNTTASVRDVQADAPRVLADAIDRALSRDSSRRFASVREFEEALLAARSTSTGLIGKVARSETFRDYLGFAAPVAVFLVIAVAMWSFDGRLGPTPPSPSAPDEPRMILVHLRDEMASISSDGKLLAMRDRDSEQRLTGDVAIQDLSDLNLNVTRLELKAGTDDGDADQPVISRNGRRVAYRWTPSGGGPAQLGVVDFPRISGTKPKYIKDDDPQTFVEYVHDWSRDGRRVLVTLAAIKSNERRLAWMSTSGNGQIETLKTFDDSTFKVHRPARVSATGEIAYSGKVVSKGGTSRYEYIYVLTNEGVDEQVVNMDASNEYPVWWPDGTRLLYTSDRFANAALWSIPIRDGRAAGSGSLMSPIIGRGAAIGLADDGSYFYRPYEPDGLRIAGQPNRTATQPFSSNAGARNELWVINFKALSARIVR